VSKYFESFKLLGETSVNEMPPAYDIAAKLPTYEEAEMSKQSDSGVSQLFLVGTTNCVGHSCMKNEYSAFHSVVLGPVVSNAITSFVL
jgi:hypothetical protein